MRQFIDSRDAQSVFKELYKYYQNSTFAQIRRDELINQLTTLKIHRDNLASRGLVQAIATFVRLMDKYDKLAPTGDTTSLLGESQRLVYLRN